MSQAAFGVMPFSTRVDLWLECAYGTVPLSQVGATFVVPVRPTRLPPCDAVVVVSIDGREHPRQVRLVHGMSDTDTQAMVQEHDAVPF